MTTSIWKYRLDVADEQIITMPRFAKILTAELQQGEPSIWVHVDPDERLVPHSILMVGTGHQREDLVGVDYVGTVQMHGGSLVFHVFDGGEIES